jgi:hypothetical protein
LTEPPKPPQRPTPQSAGAAEPPKPTAPATGAASAKPQATKSAGPPPKPLRGNAPKPAPMAGMPPAAAAPAAAAPAAKGPGQTAPLPSAVVIPPASPTAAAASATLTREPARDTLAPSSFGVLGGAKPAAPAPAPVRNARGPLPTLGDLEGATATATLRPPGAVPPPPRALPMPTPTLDAAGLGPDSAMDTPFPNAPIGDPPFTPLAGDLPPAPRSPAAVGRPPWAQPAPQPAAAAPAAAQPAAIAAQASATVVSGAAPPAPAAAAAPGPASKPAGNEALESTLDMSGSASKKATQAALIEQTRISAPVPAPGLFIADEPLEPRPKQVSLVSVERRELSRLRIGLLVLGGLLLMLAGALVVMVMRRSDANTARQALASASSAPLPPHCSLALPPSRISPTIERSVPISAIPRSDGSIALAIADTKGSGAGWIYDPVKGEPTGKLELPAGSGDVSHVTATDPLSIDRASPDFAFGRTLSPGLALGVGPAGLLRRGNDGATGVVWSLPTGVRVTPPRSVALGDSYFVTFRQGGAEGQLMLGWLRADGSAAGDFVAVEGAPKSLGTPTVALLGKEAVALFAARDSKAEPYRIFAARAAAGQKPRPAQALDLPSEGGGAIAPSLTALGPGRYLVQWTDGNVGQYQVHARILDAELRPVAEPLLISAKGANAGQGTIVVTRTATVSFFIQTTAGHDELWGASLSCR